MTVRQLSNLRFDESIINKVIERNNGLKVDEKLDINKEDLINKIKENNSSTELMNTIFTHLFMDGIGFAFIKKNN